MGIALALGLIVSACGEEASDADYAEYFSLAEARVRALDRELATITTDMDGASGDDLADALEAYAGQLESTASALDEIAAPGEAAEPHARWITGFRDLADVKVAQASAAQGSPGSMETADLAAREEQRYAEWFDACHTLQDIALVRRLEVDLLCPTVMHLQR